MLEKKNPMSFMLRTPNMILNREERENAWIRGSDLKVETGAPCSGLNMKLNTLKLLVLLEQKQTST